VRDPDGRTYAAATVAQHEHRLETARAAADGHRHRYLDRTEPQRRQGDRATVEQADLSVIRDLAGPGVSVHLAAPDGTVVASLTS